MDGTSLRSFRYVAIATCLLTLGLIGQSAVAASYIGVVEKDDVDVRAGAGKTFYVVGRLQKGSLVRVQAEVFGWYKVAPPAGVSSYVSKAWVNARGDGRSGVVTRDRTPVRSASVAGPGDSYRKQLDLSKGDVVQILAEEGSFYKISPPRGAFVYLEPGTLSRASNQDANRFDARNNSNNAESSTDDTTQRPAGDDTTDSDTTNSEDTQQADAGTDLTQASNATDEVAQDNTQGATDDSAKDNSEAFVGPPAPKLAGDAIAKQDVSSEGATTGGAEPNGGVEAKEAVKGAGGLSESQADAADTKAATDDTTAKAAVETTDDKPTQTTDDATATPPVEQKAAPKPAPIDYASLPLAELENHLVSSSKLPLEEQPIDQLIAAYEAKQGSATLTQYQQRVVAYRLHQLQRNASARDALLKLRQVRDTLAKDDDTQSTTIPVVTAPPRYAAFGRLMASGVYNGQTLPRLYRVVEPHTFRTIAYVRPTSALTADRIGRVVGVLGPVKVDPALNVKVVEPTRVDVMESVTDASAGVTPTAP